MPSLVFHLIQEQGGQPGSLDDCETDPAHPPTPTPMLDILHEAEVNFDLLKFWSSYQGKM